MLIVSCSHGGNLSKLIARKLNAKHSVLKLTKFPDDEILVRFDSEVSNKRVILVQSFYKNISDCIIEVILASATARDLDAKKIILIAPYFPYLRQDKRFRKGESISQRIISKLFDKYVDEVYIIDPHLHRKKSLGSIFNVKSVKLTANSLIAEYVKKHIKNPVVIGPDEESYKWAENIANILDVESRILKKKRYSSYHVEVKLNKKIDFEGKNAVIVDDIISTGHTILETAKLLRRLGAKYIYCICIHGIFVNDALKKLNKARIKVISTNTIPNPVARINVGGLIAESLH